MRLNKDWETLFSQRILERGREYYRDKRVRLSGKIGDYYLANVSGTASYATSVLIEDNNVTEVYCNCPYAERGFPCKHEVATILAIEDHNGDEVPIVLDNSKRLPRRNSIVQLESKEIIDLLKEKESSEEILRLIEKGIERVPEFKVFLENELQPMVVRESPDLSKNETIEQLINSVFYIIREQVKILNILDYDLAGPKFEDIAEKILLEDQSEIDHLLNMFLTFIEEIAAPNNRIMDIIESIDNLYGCLDIVPWDYYDYVELRSIPDYKEIIGSQIKNTILRLPKEVQNTIFNRLKEYSERSDVESISDLVEKLAVHLLKGEERENFQINYFIRTIKEIEDEEEQNESIEQAYQYILDNYSKETARRFRTEFPDFIGFRILRIEELIEEEKFLEAIELVKYSRVLDNEIQRVSRDYSELLIELYQKTGQADSLKRELLYYFDHFIIEEVSYFNLLKSLVSEEDWLNIRERAFKKVEKFFSKEEKIEFYIEENMLDHIKHLILHDRFIKNYLKYEESLRILFPDEIKRELKKEIDFEVYTNRIRDVDYFADLLNRMKWYPGGFTIVELTIQTVKEKYSKDLDLIVELEKRGY